MSSQPSIFDQLDPVLEEKLQLYHPELFADLEQAAGQLEIGALTIKVISWQRLIPLLVKHTL